MPVGAAIGAAGAIGSYALSSRDAEKARKDLDKGIGAINANTQSAVDAYKQYGDRAQGYLNPYVEQGGRAFGLYGDTLGVNGASARGAAEDLYNSDNMLAKQRAYDLSRSGRQANASGSFNSGAAALADSRIRMQGYGDWQNRLGAAGAAGQAAGGAAASLAAGTGAGIAGAYGGSNGAIASLYGNRATTENAATQSAISGAGAALGAYGGYSGWGNYGRNNLGNTYGIGVGSTVGPGYGQK